MKNIDIIFQFIVSIFRPVLFTYAIYFLKGNKSNLNLIYFIGYLGLFSITASIAQSYARASAIYKSVPSIKLALLTIILFLGLTLGVLINIIVYDKTIGIITGIYAVQSALLLIENKTSQRGTIILTSGIEILLIVLTFLGFSNGWNKNTDLFSIIAFSSFQLSSLFCFIYIIFFPSKDRNFDPMDNTSKDKSSGKTAFLFMASSVCLQIVCALSSIAPAFYNSVFQNSDAYTKALILLRWAQTLGSAASIMVNIFGARIFFRSMSVTLFIKFTELLTSKEREIWTFLLVGVVALLMSLFLFPKESPWVGLVVGAGAIALMNYFSSILLSFGAPELALFCQIVVTLFSLLIVSVCYGDMAPILILLVVSFVVFAIAIPFIIRGCKVRVVAG